MAELSIFIDESGDFGEYEAHSPLYLMTLVFHNQSKDISGGIEHLKKQVVEQGFPREHAVHTGPLVRREKDYRNIELPARRKLFRHLYDFARVADIRYKTLVFRKREFKDHDALVSRMSRELGIFVRDNLAFFQSFDNLIVYYDGGQKEITTIINAVFNVLVDAEIRRVKPSDYCLFQVADLFCTLELVKFKLDSQGLSTSEDDFFRGPRTFKKNYWKPIEGKRL